MVGFFPLFFFFQNTQKKNHITFNLKIMLNNSRKKNLFIFIVMFGLCLVCVFFIIMFRFWLVFLNNNFLLCSTEKNRCFFSLKSSRLNMFPRKKRRNEHDLLLLIWPLRLIGFLIVFLLF